MVDALKTVQAWSDSQSPSAVIICWGQELWAKKQAVTAIKKLLVPGGMESFCFDHFYAKDNPAIQIIDSALTSSMMSDRKLVLVEQCQKWDAKERKKMLEYIAKPNRDTSLLLDFDLEKTGKMGAIFKQKSKQVTYLEFPKPPPWKWDAYIQKITAVKGLSLDKQARTVLADYCGDDFELMRRELEKLQLYRQGETHIRAEDVEALTGKTRLVSRFELQKNLHTRQIHEALMVVQDIIDSGEQPISILSVVARYVSQLLTAKFLASKGVVDRHEIASQLGLPTNIAQGLMREQKAFSGRELKSALKLVAESDDLLKGARIEGRSVLDRLIVSLAWRSQWSP